MAEKQKTMVAKWWWPDEGRKVHMTREFYDDGTSKDFEVPMPMPVLPAKPLGPEWQEVGYIDTDQLTGIVSFKQEESA